MSESEQRLRRIEILLETCARVAVNNQNDVKELQQQMKQTSAQIERLSERVDQIGARVDQTSLQLASLADMFTESVRIMGTMQSEIKGLQTENKRILDHLFGESQN